MVIVLRQLLGQLEAGEVIAGNDAVHQLGLFKDAEVPVRRALSQITLLVEEFRKALRPAGPPQRLDQRPPATGVAGFWPCQLTRAQRSR